MVFTSLLRKSTSLLAPLASRISRSHRNYTSSISTTLHRYSVQNPSRVPFASAFQFSTAVKKATSDDSLLRVIDAEIKYAEESDDHDITDETPTGFPFSIEDNPGFQTITLTRDYQGEHIKVEVHMPDLVTGEQPDDVDDNDNDDSEKASQSSLPVVVTISKSSGPTLEFSCTAFADEISIDALAVRYPESSPEEQIAYEGPDFHDLDENLQKAFHKYLEIRGVKPSTTNFLHEYMINKDSREFLIWMNNLKKFIQA